MINNPNLMIRTSIAKARLQQQKGLGLVELMIAIAIGLIIMAGVVQLFITSTKNSVNNEAASRIQENVRYAMKRIGDDIARAGNMGCVSFAAAHETEAIVGATHEGAAQTKQFINNRLNGVTLGDTSWNDFEGSFISGVNESVGHASIIDNTDTLIVKYVDSTSAIRITGTGTNQLTLATNTDVTTDDVVFAGDCSGIYIFNPRTAGVGVATIDLPNAGAIDTDSNDVVKGNGIAYFYHDDSGTYQYQIRNSSAAGSNCAANPTQCSLYRVFNTGNAATQGATEELVLGVSDLNIQYFDDNEADWRNTAIENAGTAADDLKTIDRIKVTLTFNVTDTTQTNANNILDRTISRVFAVRNQL